ncbi:MAG: 7-cyano-7-deazaguanine synthase QueC [Bdellovibrionales bacterium]
MGKAVVLLSSGLDSTVNLYKANNDMGVALALSFDYGQKAAKNELANARALCKKLKIPHKIVELPFIKNFSSSSLTSEDLQVVTDVLIDDLDRSKETAKNVWVPNRNGIFLNIAAGFAEGLGAKYVIPGFNLEEAQTFPDNSKDYMHAATKSLSFSTANSVEIFCYTTDLNKTEIYKLGMSLNVDYELVWACYHSGESMCGECESCRRYFRAKTAYQEMI